MNDRRLDDPRRLTDLDTQPPRSRLASLSMVLAGLALASLAVANVVGSRVSGDATWAQQPELQLRLTSSEDSAASAVEVLGWTRAWLDYQIPRLSPEVLARTVRVYPQAADAWDPTFPPMAGAVSIVDDGLRFSPRYAWVEGERYRVVVDSQQPSAGDWPRHFSLQVPGQGKGPAARVEAVYPSADLLPANQLKLYVVFSEPMTTWDPYHHLRLIDETTETLLEAAFHDLRDGLWGPDSRRLTMVFDPGRIKRGLTNHERFGLPLTAGHSYRLEISAQWPDAAGRPLAKGFIKRFRATAADRSSPRPSQWSVQVPTAQRRDPAVVRFPEPLDRALLEHSFRLIDETGEAVAHDVRVGLGERRCELRPLSPWRAGRYRLEVAPTLEDLAGNNLLRLFDVDLLDGRSAPSGGAPSGAPSAVALTLTFEIVEDPAPRVLDEDPERRRSGTSI